VAVAAPEIAPLDRARATAAEATVDEPEAHERRRAGLRVAIGGLVGFAGVFALVRANLTRAFDVAVMMKLQRRWRWLRTLMAAVSWPGFPPQSRIIPTAIAAAWWTLGFRAEAVFQVGAWTTGLVSTVVKHYMKRPRPLDPRIRVVTAKLGGTSFPSGHVITYVGVYGFAAFCANALIKPLGIRRAVTGAFAGLVALIGPSRIYQGHHWPTDVLASYLLGLSYLIGLTTVYHRVKQRQASPPTR
jgi:undecaprenyl-diphosphatase